MDPYDVRKYIESTGVPYGENVTLPEDIDTNQCSDFFGTRCDHNVHAKGRRKAHIDRVDPRYNPAGHLKHDVGIPYTLMELRLAVDLVQCLERTKRMQQ